MPGPERDRQTRRRFGLLPQLDRPAQAEHVPRLRFARHVSCRLASDPLELYHIGIACVNEYNLPASNPPINQEVSDV